MAQEQAKGRGDDLESAVRAALEGLVDGPVAVRIDLPRGTSVEQVTVEIAGRVETAGPVDAEPAAEVTPPVAAGTSEPEAPAEPGGEESDEEGPSLDDEVEAAADFIEGVLDALELPGELKLRINEEAELGEVEILDVQSGALIGRRGQTLEAIQELLRSALQREFQRRSRVKVDVEGYRARRLEKLLEKAEEAIDAALDTGEPQRLEPMDVFERKAVHRVVASYDGVASRSQGREPGRRVVIDVE